MLLQCIKKENTLKTIFLAILIGVFCPLGMWGQVHGDVDTSGTVDIIDALLTAQYYVGLNPANFQAAYADVDGDTEVSIIDALLIAQFYVGLITEFPAQSQVTPAPTPGETQVPGTETQIVLNGNSITVNGGGATVNGSIVTITAGGTYTISGTLNNGQIAVDSADTVDVFLNLNGVNITNNSNAPINIINAENTEIVLVDGTTNYITDASTYVLPDPEDDEPNAAIFSKDDLRISGGGSLIVRGNYNDGIASKNGLNIKKGSGTINVTAVDDGIRGKDDLKVKGGTITINAGGDGLKADNAEESDKGTIAIEAGTLDITAGGDAITAETTVTITGGQISLKTGGGSSAVISEDLSAKGIKGVTGVTIDGGTITANCADDGIHSNGDVIINGGTFTVSTGDDAFHSDLNLTVNNGTINITKCYEGLESENVTFNDGTIHVVSSDDALNAAQAGDDSGPMPPSGDFHININGGQITINSSGDGIDSNGYIQMTNGTVLVHGPTVNMEGALDYDYSYTMNGGFIVAAGSSGMAQAPGSNSSNQNGLLINFSSQQQANTMVRIQTSNSSGILTFVPSKSYQSISFSSPELATGTTYYVYLGGSSTGTVADGLYQNGTYTPGSQYISFTVSGKVTTIGGGGHGSVF